VCYVTLFVFFFVAMARANQFEAGVMPKGPRANTQTATLRPHWISKRSNFWFRRNNAPEDFTFVYVDPTQGVHRPAFDHEGVARALRVQGVKASATNLPFSWIDTKDDCATIRFRVGDKSWEWSKNETLVAFEGEIGEGDASETLKPLTQEEPPAKESNETKIKFLNKLGSKVSVYWINSLGKEIHYQDVEAGKTKTQHTYEGHVWRVRKAGDGAVVASFAAESDERVALIKEGLPTPRLMTDLNSVTKRQTNATDDADIFIENYNVWFRDAFGQAYQLSTTGTANSSFDNITYYSPDKKFAVLFQRTSEQEHIVSEVESSPYNQLQPRLHQFQYLKPGDKVATSRPRMFDLTNKQEVPTDDALFSNPYTIQAFSYDGWNAEGTEFRIVFNQRGHQVLRVVGINTQGEVRAVVEETSKTFIDYAHKLYYREISNSSDVIWASERDGWNHLYLIDLKSGEVKNQITKGEWVVRSVDYVDEAAQQIWIKVFGAVPGQDPYYAHLARVNFDGSDFKILTEGDGSHSWYFSPDRKTFTDTWSRMDMASKTVTRDAETGSEIGVVQEGSLEGLIWPIPERFAAPGRDGNTSIHGLIFRPMDMDNSTKYPVIERIYAGPQDFSVPKEYMTDYDAHRLANLGFVVVLIDGMGTNWRSKAFHDVCHKNLKDAGFPDRIEWIKAAAKTRSWMDLEHVGVYGTSAGGQNAMGALLFFNDFYKVAYADSGCHDNRMDKLWWNEAWMGYPVDQSYEDSSNAVNAAELKGNLMLVVPELDTNVDPASTMQVVNALNRADKDYDLLFMPGAEHGVGGTDTYALRRRDQFFYRHLKGEEIPR
jgi:dipeptidyl-peptidase 4